MGPIGVDVETSGSHTDDGTTNGSVGTNANIVGETGIAKQAVDARSGRQDD